MTYKASPRMTRAEVDAIVHEMNASCIRARERDVTRGFDSSNDWTMPYERICASGSATGRLLFELVSPTMGDWGWVLDKGIQCMSSQVIMDALNYVDKTLEAYSLPWALSVLGDALDRVGYKPTGCSLWVDALTEALDSILDHADFQESCRPVSNMLYPAPRDLLRHQRELLMTRTPNVTLVQDVETGKDYFGLTGGGMDMNNDLIDAYLLCNALPPAHLAPVAYAMSTDAERTAHRKRLRAVEASNAWSARGYEVRADRAADARLELLEEMLPDVEAQADADPLASSSQVPVITQAAIEQHDGVFGVIMGFRAEQYPKLHVDGLRVRFEPGNGSMYDIVVSEQFIAVLNFGTSMALDPNCGSAGNTGYVADKLGLPDADAKPIAWFIRQFLNPKAP